MVTGVMFTKSNKILFKKEKEEKKHPDSTKKL
jgi:hypothetical protein